MKTFRERLYTVIGWVLLGAFIAGMYMTDSGTVTNSNGYILQSGP